MTERLDAETIVDGRYRILNRLGSGGMADVYCAEDLQLGRKVALKLLYRRFAEDAEFVERFRREASSAAGLQHPNVVGVYDRGEWDGTSYIAMEYIEGRTLKQIIQNEAPLDPGRAIDLIAQVLKATRFAHKRGVIHRDLKPHNVMVDAEDRAKVTDFGIAKAGQSDMTQTGSIMGTAQYLSPEQAQGLPVSAASDIYSIGIMLYEALAGRVPFDGESAVTIALKQVNEAPVAPSQYNPAVGPALEAVVLRALEKDPARRFGDADAFSIALERAQTAHPGSAVTAGATVIAPPLTGVPVRPAVAAGPPTGQLAAAPYAYPARPLEPQQQEGGRWWVAVLVGLLVVAAIGAGLLLLGSKKVTVPSVTGAPRSDATLRLRREKLKVDVILTANDAPADTVVGQDPEPGTRVSENSTVTLTVSSGPGEGTVPDVTDLGQNAALRKLQSAGFTVRTQRESSTDIAKNHVIRTSPDASSSAPKQSTVTMVVSTGPTRGPVPSVVDQNIDDARATLEGAGFKVRTSELISTDREPGTVLAQNPPADSTQPEGATVTLTIAKAPDKVDVPDVVGATSDEATTTLSAAGFTVVPKRQDVDTVDDDGKVLTQSPPGGKQTAKKGAKVTITIGHFVAPTDTTTTETTTTPTTPTDTTTTPTVP